MIAPHLKPPYLDAWRAGVCVVCGGARREPDSAFAHDRCWRSTTPGEARCLARECQQSDARTGAPLGYWVPR